MKINNGNFATVTKLMAELEPYKDTLVLNFFEVVRLDGVLQEDDGELYWIYDTHKGKIYSSAICGWNPLKGILPDDIYERLVRIWNFNNQTKAI